MIFSLILAGLAIVYLLSLLWTGYKGFYFPIIVRKTGSGIKKVACVGDSITYGYHIDNWFFHNYPYILQVLLGSGYYVRNFGLSGSTAMRSAKMSYRRFPNYRKSLKFLPDVIVILFGTNDANAQNWKGPEVYTAEYRELLQSYRELPSGPVIWLMTPPLLFYPKTEEDRVMNEHIRQERDCVKALAEELDVQVIDLCEKTKDHTDWFQPDGVHPNAKGAMEIAHIVYDAIKGACV